VGELLRKYEDQVKESRSLQKDLEQKAAGGRDQVLRARVLAFMGQSLSRVEGDLINAEHELLEINSSLAELKIRQDRKDLKVAEADIAAALAKRPEIKDIRGEIATLNKQIAGVLETSRLGEKHRTVIANRRAIAQLEKEITAVSKRLRAKLIEELREQARLQVGREINEKEARRAALTRTKNDLAGVVEKLRKDLAGQSQNSGKLDQAREEIGAIEDMAKRLKNEYEALNVAMQSPSQVRVLEDATVIKADAQARKIMMAGGGALGAFFFALLGVSWLEYRARRVDRVDDVVLGLGMRLVGELPCAKQKSRKAAGSASRKESLVQQMLTESVDATRTMLLHLAQTQGVRIVLVSSAVAGEGKTSLSCRLAASLARIGLRTLLIDADTRNPSAHKVFGGPCEPGLSDVLCGKADVSGSIRATPVPGLSLLPAGRFSQQIQAACSQGQTAALFAQLRSEFDFILIDSPPVLPVADALLLGRQADAVLLSVLCRVTRLNNLYAAARRIEEMHVPLLGVVVSGVQGSLYGASSGYPYPHRPTAGA
jgi:capsular exopolysaccharide synthesis family protein